MGKSQSVLERHPETHNKDTIGKKKSRSGLWWAGMFWRTVTFYLV